MKLDIKDPITISLTSMVIITIFSYILLYIIKPDFVTKLNKKESIVLDYKKQISYSLLFGFSTAIIIFLVFFKPTIYSPPPPVSASMAFKPSF